METPKTYHTAPITQPKNTPNLNDASQAQLRVVLERCDLVTLARPTIIPQTPVSSQRDIPTNKSTPSQKRHKQRTRLTLRSDRRIRLSQHTCSQSTTDITTSPQPHHELVVCLERLVQQHTATATTPTEHSQQAIPPTTVSQTPLSSCHDTNANTSTSSQNRRKRRQQLTPRSGRRIRLSQRTPTQNASHTAIPSNRELVVRVERLVQHDTPTTSTQPQTHETPPSNTQTHITDTPQRRISKRWTPRWVRRVRLSQLMSSQTLPSTAQPPPRELVVRLEQPAHVVPTPTLRQNNDAAAAATTPPTAQTPTQQLPARQSPATSTPESLPTPAPTPPPQPPAPRRRHAVIPHRVTYRKALIISIADLEVVCTNSFSAGSFTDICRFCGAKFFTKEFKNRQGLRVVCCKFGKVEVPPLQCPAEFRILYTSDTHRTTQFLTHIRSLNSLFAMASFKTSSPNRLAEGQGHWSFSVCGQIYHFTVGVPTSQELERPQLAHYYFLDIDEVMQRRCEILEDRADGELLEQIETLLRQHNRYVRAFKRMGEVLEEEKERRGGERPVRDVIIGFCRDGNMAERTRQYNLPESRNEIAAVFYGTEPPFNVDLKLYPRQRTQQNGEDTAHERTHELKNMHPMADPLVYPLLFPCGEDGWNWRLVHQGHKITMREFYRYRIQCRDQFATLHNAGKLFQQYLVDAWVRVEADYLWWIRQNQNQFRFAAQETIRRVLATDPASINRVGRAIVLPSGFIGGARHMQRQYLDAMAVVARHGKPDLFITFTCNPTWPEIRNTLEFRQKPEHRPDLVCRVFRVKLLEFLDDITQKQIYGVVQNYHYVIEFQKRGLPHAHIVVTFIVEDRVTTPEHVDEIVSATIPDAESQPRLYDLVAKYQVHRPCGASHPDAPCMSEGRCKKYYPKRYSETTILGASADRRPAYRRPNDGRTIQILDTVVSNTRIIPYSAYALAKYQTHINFEVVGSVETMKYLYKYVTKGVDCATIVEIGGDRQYEVDEISNYLDCRFVSAMEAAWRLLEFKMYDRSHSVMVLPVHLPGEGHLAFDPTEVDDVAARIGTPSKLEAWFALNRVDPTAREFRYSEIPEHYVWEGKESSWTRRRREGKVLGCLAQVSPRRGELDLFYLRVLLRYITGATSYDFLLTHNGTVHASFKDACAARNLLQNADEFDRCMDEATRLKHPAQLRRLFALIVCVIDDDRLAEVPYLWRKHKSSLVEDYLRQRMRRRQALSKCIGFIESVVRRNRPGFTCDSLGIALTDEDVDEDEEEEQRDDVPEEENPPANRHVFDYTLLNVDQKHVFIRVLWAVARNFGRLLPVELYESLGVDFVSAILHEQLQGSHLFYVDGPGGSGKTFLYNCLIQYISGELKLPVRAVAWTGIAANLLIGGTTVHRCFRLPLNLTHQSIAGWPVESPESRALDEVALIVWDEAPMTNRKAVEVVDKYLQEVSGKRDQPMGGKCVIFGGDFRQILPVVPYGHRASVIDATLKCSLLWRHLRHFRLSRNMRTSTDTTDAVESPQHHTEGEDERPRREGNVGEAPEGSDRTTFEELGNRTFGDWLLALGEGRLSYVNVQSSRALPNDLIEIPPMFNVASLGELLRFVYGGGVDRRDDGDDNNHDFASDRAVLCPSNAMVNAINSQILATVNGEAKTYVSTDTCRLEDDDQLQVPMDLLNSVEVAGLPPHELTLKVGSIVMLLRNLDVDRGECNGTRMRVVFLGEHMIGCELLTGERRGQRMWLPRIKMIARDSAIPHDVIRTQFPVRLAYAMTIHKSQGQTFSKLGLYLQRPCFTHGQLYVAFSRIRRPDCIKVFIEDGTTQGTFRNRGGKRYTRNVVYHSVLGHVQVADLPTAIDVRDVDVPQRERAPDNVHLQMDDRNDHIFENIEWECATNIVAQQPTSAAPNAERGQTIPAYCRESKKAAKEHLPKFEEEQLRRRVAVLDRPGTSGLARPTRVPVHRRSSSSSSPSSPPSSPPPASSDDD